MEVHDGECGALIKTSVHTGQFLVVIRACSGVACCKGNSEGRLFGRLFGGVWEGIS
jgi:hypothetical protein